MPSTLPLPRSVEPIATATPAEQLRQQLTLAKIAASSLELPKTERDVLALRMLLRSIDRAAALMPQLVISEL